jgi:hypothetical protein
MIKERRMINRAGLFIFILLSLKTNSQELRQDSIIKPASTQYADAGLLKKLLWGSNYRKVWEEPVKAPVFYLSASGLTIKKLGGGQQTRSLRLQDKSGKEWVLRTLDKDVSNVLMPAIVPKKFILPLVQDIISASFPYSPVVVYELARSAGIIAAKPQLLFVADDAALGDYRQYFANQFCFLEQREPTPDNSDTKSTGNLLEDVMKESDHQVIQKSVLYARLLDMLVADWDRHADQWRWDKVDTAGIQFYYAIPRDRDQAFFLSNGLAIKLLRNVGMKQLVGFQNDLHLKRLNKKSWTFDRTFLNGLNREDWEKIIIRFQSVMTDAAIEKAVRKLPPEIFRISGSIFISKLKKRRNDLKNDALKYYEHISRMVVINGTSEDELIYFQNSGKQLDVKIIDKKTNRLIYSRHFQSPDTWKILLNGNGGNDAWYMPAGTSSKIRMEIHGGAQKDEYQLKGSVRTVIIESKNGNDSFELSASVKKKLR